MQVLLCAAAGGRQRHSVPSVRLYFRDDDERLDQVAADHQQSVARFMISADVADTPIPADVAVTRVPQALIFHRSHVGNWWHSFAEDGADMFARMCR